MGVSLWNNLTIGINREKPVNQKRKLWYEYVPGALAFPAVTFGRKRKWFGHTQYLIIYRNDLFKKSQCIIEWINEEYLLDRYDK